VRAGTLWILSELYHPEETSTGWIMTRIAEGLAGRFDVKVLCGQPTYSARGTRAPAVEVRGGVEIRRCAGSTLDKNRLALRALNLVSLSASIFYQAIRRVRRRDLVLVVTNPPALPFLAAAACWARGASCVLLVHDVYPEALVAAGLIRRGGWGERLLSSLTRRLYRRMARVISLGRDMSALVAAKAPEAAGRIVAITNWADDELVRPRPRGENPLIEELGLTAPFVLQWAGNMGRTHALAEVVEAAERCRDRGIHFLFVGEGAKKPWLEAEVARRRLTNITTVPNQPRTASERFLNACDVALLTVIPGMAGVSVPSRMYNILASGRPMIAMVDPSTEVARVIAEEGVGWVVPVGDVDRLVAVIEEARSDPSALAAMGANARRAAETTYSFASVIARYARLVDECWDARSAGA
jgi:glycosyltransferase involved in cell wall biosynthesis